MSDQGPPPGRIFTGWHMAWILVAGFAVVLGVNLLLAKLAVSSFSGVVVENSYIASQKFNRWLEEAEENKALGWTVTPTRLADGKVEVLLDRVPARATVEGEARHPVGREPDRPMQFAAAGGSRFVSTSALPAGRWNLRLRVTSAGKQWLGETSLP